MLGRPATNYARIRWQLFFEFTRRFPKKIFGFDENRVELLLQHFPDGVSTRRRWAENNDLWCYDENMPSGLINRRETDEPSTSFFRKSIRCVSGSFGRSTSNDEMHLLNEREKAKSQYQTENDIKSIGIFRLFVIFVLSLDEQTLETGKRRCRCEVKYWSMGKSKLLEIIRKERVDRRNAEIQARSSVDVQFDPSPLIH